MQKFNQIHVFSQTKTKRIFVGTLWRDDNNYYFKYDTGYSKLKAAIPLGPEFELWKDKFKSKKLFSSLLDRIPSKDNPAYKDYCEQWGIDPKESDLFILLVTVGRRGPSTFIFEKGVQNRYESQSVLNFRKKLKLSQYEFESLLGISHATLQRLENEKSTNETILRYIELVENVPSALLWLLDNRGKYLHDNTVNRLLKFAKTHV